MKNKLQNGIPKLLATLPEENIEENVKLFFLKKIDSFFTHKGKKGSKRRNLVQFMEVNI